MNLYAVIMAGGVGSRFWPRSREKKPKQLLTIFGEQSMIRQTYERLSFFIDPKNILVVTGEAHAEEIIEQLPELPIENVIAEPFGRNTAACIGVAAQVIKQRDPEAISIVVPADHIIGPKEAFKKVIEIAANAAEVNSSLVTIGIPPSRPETGYGYIQIDDASEEDGVYKVLTFAEKPNLATAIRFIESGDFMWNSGMFIWNVSVILEEIMIYMPELYEALGKLEPSIGTDSFYTTLTEIYSDLKSVSIDYGIMEKSKRVFLTKGIFSWSDVGSWEEVFQISEKNDSGVVSVGNVFNEHSTDSYIYSPDKFAAIVGVDNLIVINTNDSLLVCRRDKAQDVKKVVDFLKQNERKELL